MPNIQQQLERHFREAIVCAAGDDYADVDPLIRPSNNEKFGDFQANVAMSLGKQLGEKPRDVAQRIVHALQLDAICEKIELAGPGFINLHLRSDYLADQMREMALTQTNSPQTVVVDYGGPNVAKEMHVGHLRSTIIGDTIARVLECLGHRVIRQNHIGDWGTQFGMLIEYMLDTNYQPNDSQSIGDLNVLYQKSKVHFDEDADFASRARTRVVKLQGADEQTLSIWRDLVAQSEHHFQAVYQQMNVLLVHDDVCGESFYNDRLPIVVHDLQEAGLLKESQGAEVVFLDGFFDRDENPLPLIVRKGDGGYLYATTDLAAACYRIKELEADRVIYVTDARQSQHFAMVFATLRAAGWARCEVRLDHVPFGTMLGKDRRPFKTREGEIIKLVALLDEARQRAADVVAQKNSELSADDQEVIADVIGIGSLKYADLSSDRIKDYVFDWDRMLSFDGNTAPYLINAYVRIQSIFRKARGEESHRPESMGFADGVIVLRESAERELALKLLQFGSAVEQVAQTLEPHRLCTYLYELATAFHHFYEHCPVLKAESDAVKISRLALCDCVARTLKQGLNLLGIGVVEQM